MVTAKGYTVANFKNSSTSETKDLAALLGTEVALLNNMTQLVLAVAGDPNSASPGPPTTAFLGYR